MLRTGGCVHEQVAERTANVRIQWETEDAVFQKDTVVKRCVFLRVADIGDGICLSGHSQ